jgi:membrane-bound metal-dependent hydrolase YbcI (DUF457 family)
MADFRTHLTVSTACGLGYGAAAVNPMGFTPEAGLFAAGLTAAGGMLPDLDSDSGRPIRELFALAGAVVPLLLLPRLQQMNMAPEGTLAFLVGCYVFVRYGLSWALRRITVHRGMFHSIPAMLIAGLIVYLEYGTPNRDVRILLAGGVMLGFLSHLILDELYSVDFNGVKPRLKSSAGSAIKFFSSSFLATAVCYTILGLLLVLALTDYEQATGQEIIPEAFWQVTQLFSFPLTEGG